MAPRSRGAALVGAILLGLACGGGDEAPAQPGRRALTPRACSLPAGHGGKPESVEEVVALINALPRPVTVSCLLEALDRPFHVDLSAGNFSLQPAYGENNPRIMVQSGALVLTVVPRGKGAGVVEFGVRRGNQSLKAEVVFPVTEELTPGAPYARVQGQGGTVCRTCHFNERRADHIDFAEAYWSDLIAPALENQVDRAYLDWVIQQCDPAVERERCAIFDAIFGHGDAIYEPLVP